MVSRKTALVAIACALWPAGAQMTREWRSVRSAHFEIVSRYEASRIRPLVAELEWARDVFETNFGWKSAFERPALILLPDDPYEFEKMAGSRHVGGFYLHAPWRDLIAVAELAGARETLLHEYTHLLTRHQGARYPAWLNEGLAEYFSSMKRTPGGVEVGARRAGRPEVTRFVWVPVAYMASLQSATELESRDARERFYTQSWLFTHMLRNAPAYSGRFGELRALMQDGASTQEALRRVYGKSLVEFDNDARAWARQPKLGPQVLKAPEAAALSIEESPMSDVEVQIARATIAASRERDAAGRDYAQLSKLAGKECRLQAGLGDLAFAAGLMPQAGAHYRAAQGCGVTAAELNEHIAEAMSFRKNVPASEYSAASAAAGEGRARMLLGAGRFFEGDYEGALRELAQAVKLNSYDEYRKQRMTALALSRLGRHEEAVAAAEQLRAMAREPDQRDAALLTLEDARRARREAEAAQDPNRARDAILNLYARVEGVLTRVDCLGARARFWVRSGSVTRKLMIADPSEVVTGPEGTELEFGCGEQRREVVIGYQAEADPKSGTEGRVRYLEFKPPGARR